MAVGIMQKENKIPSETYQYVGPYRLEKTLGKGQTGESNEHTNKLRANVRRRSGRESMPFAERKLNEQLGFQ